MRADCPVGAVCTDGVCIVETGPCVGDTCPCRSDFDCEEGERCDTSTGACVVPECRQDADCGLGEVCSTRGACVVDVEADRDYDGVPDGSVGLPVDIVLTDLTEDGIDDIVAL